MTRKDLQERFLFHGENKEIHLFTKDKNNAYGIGYLGTISLVRGNAVFNDKTYKDLDSLSVALDEWAKTLEYPVDTYYPEYREGWRTESRILWYLTSVLNFSLSKNVWSSGQYERSVGEYKIAVMVKSVFDEEAVEITSRIGEYHISRKVTDAKEGIDFISTFVRADVLSMAGDMMSVLQDCPDTKVVEGEMAVEDNESILGFRLVDFKTTMIEMLEKELAKLKMLKGEE